MRCSAETSEIEGCERESAAQLIPHLQPQINLSVRSANECHSSPGERDTKLEV